MTNRNFSRVLQTINQQQTFYKRPLSSELISFSSREGKKLFQEALQEGNMENYFPLSEQLVTQSEPAYCGPASLTMVLNALKVDPQKTWKGIWRWFNEEVLHCSSSDKMKEGMNLEEMTLLARCNGLHTQTFRCISQSSSENIMISKKLNVIDQKKIEHSHHANCQYLEGQKKIYEVDNYTQPLYINNYDVSMFKTILMASCRIPGLYSIVNFGRKELQQTGQGHFACIGGFNQNSNKVLVLDTARYKYPPFWVNLQQLFESSCSLDEDSGKTRGLLVLSNKLQKQCNIHSQLFDDTVINEQYQIGIKLNEIMDDSIPQDIKLMSDMSLSQLQTIINVLNSQKSHVYLFKFIHDLQKKYFYSNNFFDHSSESQNISIGNGQLSKQFFDQLQVLRSSCNDFEGIKKRLVGILNSHSNNEKDLNCKKQLNELIIFIEQLTAGYSLDMISLVIIAMAHHIQHPLIISTNTDQCAFTLECRQNMKKQLQIQQPICCKVNQLEIFQLFR